MRQLTDIKRKVLYAVSEVGFVGHVSKQGDNADSSAVISSQDPRANLKRHRFAIRMLTVDRFCHDWCLCRCEFLEQPLVFAAGEKVIWVAGYCRCIRSDPKELDKAKMVNLLVE